jgi:hypothetical protein
VLSQWTLVESWECTVLSTPAIWVKVEELSAQVGGQASWCLVDERGEMLIGRAAWREVDAKTSALAPSTAWLCAEEWAGTLETKAGWRDIEQWKETMRTLVAWSLLEEWMGAFQASAGWLTLEAWHTAVGAPAGWGEIELLYSTIEAKVAWQPIESSAGKAGSLTEWQMVDEWISTSSAPVGWHILDSLTGGLWPLASWFPVEFWVSVQSTGAFWIPVDTCAGTASSPAARWFLLEEWGSASLSFVGWLLLEGWRNNIVAFAGWRQAEVIQAEACILAEWQSVETVAGAIGTRASWSKIESLQGSSIGPAKWEALESVRVSIAPAWILLETISARVSSPTGWASLEALSAHVVAFRASWSYLEFISSSLGARPAWVRVDGTSSPVCAPVPFTISLSAPPGALLQGESLTLTVAVSRLYPWYSRTVFLSALNLPPYSSATFSPSSGVPDFSSTLAISTSTSTPAGTYLLTVAATDGYMTSMGILQLTISPPPPPKYPPTSALKAISPFWRASLPVPLEAEASDLDGTVVRVLLFYRHSPDNIAWDNWRLYGEDNQAPWSWSFSPAENEGYYELYSVAVDNDGLTEEAPVLPDVRMGVDLTSPPAPVPLGPVGDAPTPSKVRLSWVPVSDLSGVQYEVQVDRNSDFSSPLLYSTVENSLEFECPFEGRVFWRVRAVNGSGMASVSGPASFVCIRATPVEKTVSNLPAFTPAEFDLTPMEPLFIRKVTLTFSSPVDQATVRLAEFERERFAERFAWLPSPEYEYAAWLSLDVPTTFIRRTKVEFEIFRSWLRERDLDENRVILQRLYQGRWENIPATLVGSDEEKFYYTATFAGFHGFLSATASKRAPPPPPPPPPLVPTPTPPYLFYAFLTMVGAAGLGFAYFLYRRRLVTRPARPIRPSFPPVVPLEKLGPRPELRVLPIPPKLPPLGVQRVVRKAVPAAGEVLEALKRAGARRSTGS